MGNQEYVDREKILNSDTADYGFDKVLRGYDIKQVNEYISNLAKTNKQASLMFDQRLADARNDAEMLQCELDQTKASLQQMKDLYNEVSTQRDRIQLALNKNNTPDENSDSVKQLEEKLSTQITQNRLLREENKKLQENNANMQRDVAHLTKKADKNRFEIKNLQEQLSQGMTNSTQKEYSELSKVYQNAIDKAEDLIFRMQTEFSLAHSKAEDIKDLIKQENEQNSNKSQQIIEQQPLEQDA